MEASRCNETFYCTAHIIRSVASEVLLRAQALLQGSMLGEEESRPAMSFKEESRGFEQLQEPEPPLSELDSLLHTQRHSALLSAALECAPWTLPHNDIGCCDVSAAQGTVRALRCKRRMLRSADLAHWAGAWSLRGSSRTGTQGHAQLHVA